MSSVLNIMLVTKVNLCCIFQCLPRESPKSTFFLDIKQSCKIIYDFNHTRGHKITQNCKNNHNNHSEDVMTTYDHSYHEIHIFPCKQKRIILLVPLDVIAHMIKLKQE